MTTPHVVTYMDKAGKTVLFNLYETDLKVSCISRQREFFCFVIDI
jgi:hypothetical protein